MPNMSFPWSDISSDIKVGEAKVGQASYPNIEGVKSRIIQLGDKPTDPEIRVILVNEYDLDILELEVLKDKLKGDEAISESMRTTVFEMIDGIIFDKKEAIRRGEEKLWGEREAGGGDFGGRIREIMKGV